MIKELGLIQMRNAINVKPKVKIGYVFPVPKYFVADTSMSIW